MEFHALGRSVFDLFFPRRCLNCHSVISVKNPLCVKCSSELPYTHWKLNSDNYAFEKLHLLCKPENAYSLLFFRHDNVTQKLLHHLKYNNHQEIGSLLGKKIAGEIDLSVYQGIIPIPVHPKKLKERGYNQVTTLTEELAKENRIPVIKDFLIRIQNNRSQVTKSRDQRLKSIQNAFGLTDKKLKGHYILVDDVITTGATLSTCINLIHSETDLKISVITIACAGG